MGRRTFSVPAVIATMFGGDAAKEMAPGAGTGRRRRYRSQGFANGSLSASPGLSAVSSCGYPLPKGSQWVCKTAMGDPMLVSQTIQ